MKHIKVNILIIVLMFCFTQFSCITDQNKYKESDLFGDFETQPGFTVLHLPPVLFKIILSVSDEDDNNSKELFDKVELIKLMFFEENEKTIKVDDVKQSINEELTEFNYNLLTNIANEGNNVSIYIIESEHIIHEVLITVVSQDSYIGVNVIGNLTKDDVLNVYKSINMDKLKDFEK